LPEVTCNGRFPSLGHFLAVARTRLCCCWFAACSTLKAVCRKRLKMLLETKKENIYFLPCEQNHFKQKGGR